MSRLYTAQEIAERLKIKKNTVYELIKRGELQSSKVGKQIRVSQEQLEQYLHGTTPEDTGNWSEPVCEPESSVLKRDYLRNASGLIISGQNSTVMELLCSRLEINPQFPPLLQSHMNCYNSLYSLYFGKVHMVLANLDIHMIQHLCPGMPLVAQHLCSYKYGFYTKKGNPKNFQSVSDLIRSDITLANREKGSGMRIFLDNLLRQNSIDTRDITGYGHEMVSNIAVAGAVLSDSADIGFCDQFILRQFPDLDFHPVGTCSMRLVFSAENKDIQSFQTILEIAQSEDFKAELSSLIEYDTSKTGNIRSL